MCLIVLVSFCTSHARAKPAVQNNRIFVMRQPNKHFAAKVVTSITTAEAVKFSQKVYLCFVQLFTLLQLPGGAEQRWSSVVKS